MEIIECILMSILNLSVLILRFFVNYFFIHTLIYIGADLSKNLIVTIK